jgi:hypothetical protein
MNEKSWLRLLNSWSDNLKSKIKNLKWGEAVAIGIAYVMCGAVVEPQQPKKVRRLRYISPSDPAIDSSRSEAIRLVLRPRWGERLSTHTWRAKIFSSAAQISGIYTVATSQTMCKSTLA